MLDAGNAYALAARGVQAATMAAAAVLVARTFSPEAQGLFFTFLSLGTLIQLGEFGIGYVLLQTGSHLAAGQERGRLRSLAQLAWQRAAVLLCGSALACAGLGAWLLHQGGLLPAALVPWLAYAAVVPLAQGVNLALLYVEGARSVRQAWRLRLVQESLAGMVFLGSMLAGAGVCSLAVHALARAVLGVVGVWPTLRAQRVEAPVPFDWRREAWPFQWRVGLSALAGFLVFQAFTPLLLVEQGAAAAGRFGLMLAVCNMLLLVAGSWPLSQAARYGKWLAEGRHHELRRTFRHTLLGSALLTLLLGAGVLGGQLLLERLEHPVAARLPDASTTAALLLATLLQQLTGTVAVLLRAERREPLLGLSIVGGVVTLAVVWWAARQGTLLGPALANAGMALLGALWVWRLHRRFVARRLVPAEVAR